MNNIEEKNNNFRIIFSNNTSEQYDKSFIFTIKSEESYQRISHKYNQVIYASNPNKILYGICFTARDYFDTVIN